MTDAWNGTCFKCGNTKAYEGLSSWECPNEHCSNFSKKQKALVDAELKVEAGLQKPEQLELDFADTEPCGPPDDVDDPYAFPYGTFGMGAVAPKKKTVAAVDVSSTKDDDADSAAEEFDLDMYNYQYGLPDDMALD